MATSGATAGRPSSSHRSERLPPNHGSNNHGSGRNGVANFSVNNQQQQQPSQNLRSKNVSANSRRSVTPTSRNRSPPQENDPGFDFSCFKCFDGLLVRLCL